MAIAALAGALAAGQPQAGPAEEPASPTSAPVDMSASDVGAPLTRLLLEKPAIPITLPRDQKPPVTHDLPLESTMVVDRLCRLSHDDKADWWVLTFPPEPGRKPEVPRRVLPCRLLEEMETSAAASPGAAFRVSGETTVCAYKAYVLLSKVIVLSAPASAPATQPAIAPPTQPVLLEDSVPRPPPRPAAAAPAASGPASRPASRPGREASSTDILQGLLSEDVGKPVLLPTALPPKTVIPSVAPGGGKPLAAGREALIIDRVVRILPQDVGHWLAAHFESDNTLEDPPMRLLPCGLVDKVQSDEARKRPGAVLVFRVSGVVTQYKGEQFLLLRKLIIERNMGRF